MKKYCVCIIADVQNHCSIIVKANDESDIKSYLGEPTDEMMNIIRKNGIPFEKDEICLDVTCIEDEYMIDICEI